jgi:hypothetical protein
MRRAIAALTLLLALLGAPAAALGQSAGDEQYVDPFQGEGGGQPEQPAPESQPAPAPEPQPAPEQPTAPAAPAESGNGVTETAPPAAVPAQTDSAAPTLPRTGAPILVLAAAGYALLLAGIAIRRSA